MPRKFYAVAAVPAVVDEADPNGNVTPAGVDVLKSM